VVDCLFFDDSFFYSFSLSLSLSRLSLFSLVCFIVSIACLSKIHLEEEEKRKEKRRRRRRREKKTKIFGWINSSLLFAFPPQYHLTRSL